MTEQTSSARHDASSAAFDATPYDQAPEASPPADLASMAPAQEPAQPMALPRFNVITSDWARAATVAALTLIILFGGYLRLTNVNWDASGIEGTQAASGHLHPDERFLAGIQNDINFPSSPLNYLDTDNSPLNPYNIQRSDGTTQTTFVYGTLPLFMNKALGEWLDKDADGSTHVGAKQIVSALDALPGITLKYDDGRYMFNGGYDGHLVGRALAGLFDLGTIVFIFLIGRLLVDRRVGLLAAFLYAFSAAPIQNSHFFVVDPYVTFFATMTIYFAIRSAKRGGYGNFAMAGIGAGLAAASKITAVSLLPVVLLAVFVYAWPGIQPYIAHLWRGKDADDAALRDGTRLDQSVLTVVLGSLVAVVAGFIAFRLTMPYAFNAPALSDWWHVQSGHIGPLPIWYPDIINQHWLADQVAQENLLSGDAAFPPNVQWIGRSPWLWPMQQIVSWGAGPALGITMWLGVPFAMAYAWVKRDIVWLVPLAWVLGYFGFMGGQYSLYMRYFLPLYPTLTIFAAFLLMKTWDWSGSKQPFAALGRSGSRLAPLKPALAPAMRTGVGVVAVMTALMGISFYAIYTRPVTRVAASEWIYENVPAGSVIGREHWDDSVPYQIEGVDPQSYQSVEFENFNTDTEARVEELLADIDTVDYIMPSSRRLSGTIPRVPAVWPITSRYYEALESGELGFEKVAEFTSFPSVFGFELDDTGAEESYSVYDHPIVTVYKKTDAYSAEKAREVLGANAFEPGVNVLPGQAGENALRFRPDVLERQQEGGTWTSIFDANSLPNRYPLLFWLLAMELAALAVTPIAFVLFRALPDRGYLLTKPLGILLLSYVAYAPAAFLGIAYTRAEIAGALGAMLVAGAATAYLWRSEIAAFIRERWRFLLGAEALFLGIFAGAYWVRLQNPDLWHPSRGGEKPMDLAYFIGVIRTTDLTQGPIDPWNAGGYLNYYYFGQFISATVTKLTGIVPEVAYNLVVPMFFALAAAATFSVTYNLAEATRRMMKRRAGGGRIGISGPVFAGLGAIFLVLLAGNLKAVGVLESQMARISPWNPDIALIGPLVTIFGGFYEIATGDATLRGTMFNYDWWDPSRALDVVNPQTEVTPITEFPFWTFLFADLHAHLMAIPFAMTAAGVALAAVMNLSRLNPATAPGNSEQRRSIASWGMVVLLAVIVGALRWINTWDFPPFLLIAAAGIFIAERAQDGRFTVRALATGLLKTGVMGVLTIIFYAPLGANYNQFYSSTVESDQTTALHDYFSHFGILLIFLLGFVLFQMQRAITKNYTLKRLFFGSLGERGKIGPVQAAPLMIAFVLGGIAIVALSTHNDVGPLPGFGERGGVIALSFVALVAVAICAVRELRNPSPVAPVMLLVYAMIGLGFGLSGGVELITLEGDIGRMNTVFKFYLHVWMLWGVAAAFGTWYVFAVARPHEAFMRRAGDLHRVVVAAPRYAFGIAVTVVVLLAMVYPVFGTRARIHDRFDPAQGSGNNGMEYMDEAVYTDFNDRDGLGGEHILKYERDAINWLRENVDGTPTTIEAQAPLYHYGSRIAIYTGLPTVLGWDWHQSQQRPRFAAGVQQRRADVNAFYASEDIAEARRLIDKYDVEWVIVGSVERNYYPPEGLAKFDSGLGGILELAYTNDGVQIWHVIPRDQLPEPAQVASP